MKYKTKPALCLDLDGTVRRSKGGAPFGPTSPEDVELLPGVAEKVWAYRDAGHHIVGVTNQGVIAYGALTEEQVQEIVLATRYAFGRRGDPFHAVFASPTLPPEQGGKVAPHARVSLLRKPQIGMLVLAEVDALGRGVVIDWPNSLFVGDRPEDEGCARAAGIPFQRAWQFFGWAPSLAGKTWDARTWEMGCGCSQGVPNGCTGPDPEKCAPVTRWCLCICHVESQ